MKTVNYINEKNETFDNIKDYKSEGNAISREEILKLVDSGDFWLYNGFPKSVLNIKNPNERYIMTKEKNCIRRLTVAGYVTIALKTIKK